MVAPLSLDSDLVVSLYVERQLSAKAIAAQLGCSRAPVLRILRECGVAVRGRSSSMFVRMSQTTAADRKRLASDAHAALRGKPHTAVAQVNQAKGRAKVGKPSELEAVFCDALHAQEFDVVPQMPFGPYNIDLAIPAWRVAVEIDPGNWHSSPTHAESDAAKDRLLLAEGWTVVRFSGARVSMRNAGIRALAEKLVADAELRRFKPAAAGEHWVVTGHRDHTAIARGDTKERTVILTHVVALDATR
jgi:very-short-patch-repair endonuclease